MKFQRLAVIAVAVLLTFTGCGPDLGQRRKEALEQLAADDAVGDQLEVEYQRRLESAQDVETIDLIIQEINELKAKWDREKEEGDKAAQAEAQRINEQALNLILAGTCEGDILDFKEDGTLTLDPDFSLRKDYKLYFVPTRWEFIPAEPRFSPKVKFTDGTNEEITTFHENDESYGLISSENSIYCKKS